MSHGQFIVAYETAPLGLLISTPKTLRILLVHKIRDTRFQLLLINWACTLLAVLGASIYGFNLMPMFLAVGFVAEGVFLFLLMLCIGAGDILLDFILTDFCAPSSGCAAANSKPPDTIAIARRLIAWIMFLIFIWFPAFVVMMVFESSLYAPCFPGDFCRAEQRLEQITVAVGTGQLASLTGLTR